METQQYRIISKKRNEKKSLEGIVKAKRKLRKEQSGVSISDWNTWENSFWVKIQTYSNSVIIDSGVIEELAKEIKRLKKC